MLWPLEWGQVLALIRALSVKTDGWHVGRLQQAEKSHRQKYVVSWKQSKPRRNRGKPTFHWYFSFSVCSGASAHQLPSRPLLQLWASQCLPTCTFSTARLVFIHMSLKDVGTFFSKRVRPLGTYTQLKAKGFISSSVYQFSSFSNLGQYLRHLSSNCCLHLAFMKETLFMVAFFLSF